MDIKKLEELKYSELQKLAKQNGIKANMKLNKLREALVDHFKSSEVNQKEQMSTVSKTTKVQGSVKPPVTENTPTASRIQKNSKSLNSPKTAPKTPTATKVAPESTALSSFVTNQSTIPDEPTPEPQNTRKRRSTFETVPTPELHTEKVPDIEHTRRSTYVVKTPQSEKKTASVKKSESKTPKESESKTQIPRFAAFLAKRKQETESESKVLTPGKTKDWKKIHEKNFEKMESIDEYLAKKRKRNEDYTESVKKTKKILSDTLAMVDKLKSYKTPTGAGNPQKTFVTKTPNNAPFKPSVLSTKDMKLNFSENRKSPRNSSAAKPFKPSVFSTKNMNLNFTSPAPSRKSAGSVMNKSKTTPFKFNASLNNTLNGSMSAKKSTFDLQASLARPITWKAHKGKLKPLNSSGYQTSIKTPTTQTRDDRRKIMAAKRSSAKFNTTLERRGIKV